MVAAFINGLVGLGLCFAIGIRSLEMPFEDILLSILVSNFAALVSLLATLKAEKNPWLAKVWLSNIGKTWSFLAVLYFGILLLLVPPLRSVERMLYLMLPLMLSTGFAILIFGPIQDELVKRQQKRAQLAHRLETSQSG